MMKQENTQTLGHFYHRKYIGTQRRFNNKSWTRLGTCLQNKKKLKHISLEERKTSFRIKLHLRRVFSVKNLFHGFPCCSNKKRENANKEFYVVIDEGIHNRDS